MPEYDYEEYARRYDDEDNLEGEQFSKVQETTEEPKNEIPKIESTLPEDEEDGEEW
jgi:hypothetical protein